MLQIQKKFYAFGLLIFFVFLAAGPANSKIQKTPQFQDETRDAIGVCPPFHLLDGKGNIINPLNGVNPDAPYSPKQTCGKCHDYDKITSGYHFRQGKGQDVPQEFKERYPWVTSPAQYGGRW
jgi:hypothetical protein